MPNTGASETRTWSNDEVYCKTTFKLSNAFRKNFKLFEEFADEEIRC